MRLFAVRVIKDKQPVGFFWAPDAMALWWMIDSVCDPGDCECRRVRERAAIVWDGKVNAEFGTGRNFDDETGDDSALVELQRELSFEYAFEDYILGEVKGGWIKVPFADEPGGGLHDLASRRVKKQAEKKKAKKKK